MTVNDVCHEVWMIDNWISKTHLCARRPGHEGNHICPCGEELDDPRGPARRWVDSLK